MRRPTAIPSCRTSSTPARRSTPEWGKAPRARGLSVSHRRSAGSYVSLLSELVPSNERVGSTSDPSPPSGSSKGSTPSAAPITGAAGTGRPVELPVRLVPVRAALLLVRDDAFRRVPVERLAVFLRPVERDAVFLRAAVERLAVFLRPVERDAVFLRAAVERLAVFLRPAERDAVFLRAAVERDAVFLRPVERDAVLRAAVGRVVVRRAPVERVRDVVLRRFVPLLERVL